MKSLEAMVQGGDWLGIAKAITYAHVESGLSSPSPNFVAAQCETGVAPRRSQELHCVAPDKTFTCQRNGIDGFISAVDAVIDRVEEAEDLGGYPDPASDPRFA